MDSIFVLKIKSQSNENFYYFLAQCELYLFLFSWFFFFMSFFLSNFHLFELIRHIIFVFVFCSSNFCYSFYFCVTLFLYILIQKNSFKNIWIMILKHEFETEQIFFKIRQMKFGTKFLSYFFQRDVN